MNILETPLNQEIQAVLSSSAKPTAWRWECVIQSPNYQVKPLYIEKVEVNRDYIDNFTELRVVTVAIQAGDYDQLIVQDKTNLFITLRRIPLYTYSVSADKSRGEEVFRYRAYLTENRSELIESNTLLTSSREKANRTMIRQVSFQLMNPVIERLRIVTIGGIFRNVTGGELIRHLLTHYSVEAGDDSSISIKGVDLSSQYNPSKFDHIVIPHGTPLVGCPNYVDRQTGGVYPTGLSFHLQSRLWYVYSPYAVKRYSEVKRNLTVINIPPNQMPGVETTYRETNGQVIILATAETQHTDTSEEQQLNEGNGVRFIDARKIMDGFASVEGNRLTVNKAKNVSEYQTSSRNKDINIVLESTKPITSDFNTENSKLARRAGSYIQFVWEHGDENLLYPGMPVRYVYIKNNKIEQLYGSVIGTHMVSTRATVNVGEPRFTDKVVVSLFVGNSLD